MTLTSHLPRLTARELGRILSEPSTPSARALYEAENGRDRVWYTAAWLSGAQNDAIKVESLAHMLGLAPDAVDSALGDIFQRDMDVGAVLREEAITGERTYYMAC